MVEVLIFMLLVVAAVGFVKYKMDVFVNQGTARTYRENSNLDNRNQSLPDIRTESPLPPIKRPNRTDQMQNFNNQGVNRLPSYKNTVESIYEYPHCPKCWAKNRMGETQKVVWDIKKGCFRCNRNHYFRRNGKLIDV